MCLETEIRTLNAKGYSRKEIGRALNIPISKVTLMCESLSVPTRRKINKSPSRRPHQERHALRGVEGTLEDLMKHFCVEWKTETVRRRLREGKSLEDAFFTGRPKIRSWYRETLNEGMSATRS
jgi:hypothetical protein